MLPAARRLYLLGSLAAVATALIALGAALVFHLMSLPGSSEKPVPPPLDVVAKPIELTRLNGLFSGPTGLRIGSVPTERPLKSGAVVAIATADSSFGLSDSDGIQIIGGRDAELVTEGDHVSEGGRVTARNLVATEALADRIAAAPKATQGPTIQLRLLASDANGNRSAPANHSFEISFGSGTATVETAPPQDDVEYVGGDEELRPIALALAAIAAPRGTPENFDAYQVAIDLPKRCGAAGDAFFNGQYARAFQHVRKRLTPSNLDAFYRGVCESWSAALADAVGERQRADANRMAVIQENLETRVKAQLRQVGSRAIRNTALAFAAFAICFFMVVALFLAFLAIEGHSNAMREAIQLIAAADRRDRDA